MTSTFLVARAGSVIAWVRTVGGGFVCGRDRRTGWRRIQERLVVVLVWVVVDGQDVTGIRNYDALPSS